MMVISSKRSSQQGFTLIELLLAAAIAGIVGMAAYAIFSSSNWSSTVQEQVSEAQQNARIAMDRLSRDLRMAGFGLPEPLEPLDFNGTTFRTPVTIVNSSTGPDTVTILGIGEEAGRLVAGAGCNGAANTELCLDSVAAFRSSSNEFVPTRRYITLDGIAFFELATDQTNLGARRLELNTDSKVAPPSLSRSYASGTPVYIIQAITYSIATDLEGCSVTNPCLASADFTMIRGGNTPGARQLLVENIEDLQLAYSTGDSTFVDSPADASEVVAARVNVVAKTRAPDTRGGIFRRPALEDRSEGSVDNFRRRIATKVVKIRNSLNGP